jgi:hypothetical protein
LQKQKLAGKNLAIFKAENSFLKLAREIFTTGARAKECNLGSHLTFPDLDNLCPKENVRNILYERKCTKENVRKKMSERKCPKENVQKKMTE